MSLFGTDGVRGIPGQYPLVPHVIRRIAYAAAKVLRERSQAPRLNGTPPSILVGRDTRRSGPILTRLLAEGFARAGCAAKDLGVLPTPAVAHLVPRRGALGGVVVSASHNSAEFNGIKFVLSDGSKMGAAMEKSIEGALDSVEDARSAGARPVHEPGGEQAYLDFLRSTFPAHLDLSGLRVAADCANGAAYRIAPRLLRLLGAEVFAIGCRPDGTNINEGCGALDTEALRREVVRRRCHVGFALDGDADRAMFADGRGRLCDGDVLLSIAAARLREEGRLRGGKIVVTVMSNYGLLAHLKARGIGVVTVPVGDRNVSEAIDKEGLSLGGEASGHIIFREFGPTGDGLVTALQTLAALAASGRPLAWWRGLWRPYPQVLRNVRIETRIPLEELPGLRRCVRDCERRLRGKGRVVVRYSGTEPVLRVLVEGPEAQAVHRLAASIIDAYHKEIACPRN